MSNYTFSLEALQANEGDALVLQWGTKKKKRIALIDGGRASQFPSIIKPRLDQIAGNNGDTIKIDRVIVTHVDGDHIEGLMRMFAEMERDADRDDPPTYRIGQLWHNSFDLSGELFLAGLADAPAGRVVVANAVDGINLSGVAKKLKIPINRDFNGAVTCGDSGCTVNLPGGLAMQVLSPTDKQLESLKTKWAAYVKKNASKIRLATTDDETLIHKQAMDRSVWNLTSLAILAEFHEKTMLLCGDALDKDIVAGLKRAGRLDSKGKFHVDVMKVSHHGSDRNNHFDFFKNITADHYVFSADGKHGNPDRATLLRLLKARGKKAEYTVHVTNRSKSKYPELAENMKELQENLPPKAKLVARKNHALGITVPLF
jgi:beta-lactamase superfamily II metal-dependent hydrolase